jgi:transcriptional regulator of arginine metabolism
MANKRERHAVIRQIVESRVVSSQEELRKLLRQRGWDVTQSTLSRDLREMRLARVPIPDGLRYAATDAAADTADAGPGLEEILPPLFVRVDGVAELVVLRTIPGGAQPVAVALDAEERSDVVGTIAGDDTILIVCRSAAARERLIRQFRALAAH